MTGKVKLENMAIIREVESILRDNEALIRLYASDEAHPTEGSQRSGASRQATEGRRRKDIDPDKDEEKRRKREARVIIDIAKEKSLGVRNMNRLLQSTRRKYGIEKNRYLNTLHRELVKQFEEAGYTGEELEKNVKATYNMHMRILRDAVKRQTMKVPEIKAARREARLFKYSEMYMQSRDFLTRQDYGAVRGPRNETFRNETDKQQAEKSDMYTRFSEGELSSYNVEDMERMHQSFTSLGKSRGPASYVDLNPRKSIPTLVEEATTLEQLNDVRQYVEDRIPFRYLREVEKRNQTTYRVAGADKKDVEMYHLQDFIEHHATRIDPNWTTRQRIFEKEGIINAGGQPL